MTKSELLKKLRELHKLQQKCKAVKEKVDGLKDEIKAEMTSQEVKKMQFGEIKVSCTKYISHRFDTTAFKVEHKDLYESYLKEVQATRFTLTKKAKKVTKKLIRKVDRNEFEVARENLKMLEPCTTREEMIALLNTTTKDILSFMAIEITKENWDYTYRKKQDLVEFVADEFIKRNLKITKFEVGKTYVYGFESTFEVNSRTDKEIWLDGEKYEILIDTKQKCEKVKIGVTAELKATEVASEEFLKMQQESIEKYLKEEQEIVAQAKKVQQKFWTCFKSKTQPQKVKQQFGIIGIKKQFRRQKIL